jgi:hypothetical protein
MRSLPDHVREAPAIRVTSIARAMNPDLGLSADGLGSRRVEDAALTVLAAVYAERGPVREMLVCERVSFDRLVYAANRCPVHRGGE